MILIDTKPTEQNNYTSKFDFSSNDEDDDLSFHNLLKMIDFKAKPEQTIVDINHEAFSENNNFKKNDLKALLSLKETPSTNQENSIKADLQKEPTTKTVSLETLLGFETDDFEEDISLLNQDIVEKTDIKDLKVLIKSSKDYLKDKIVQSDDYKRATTKDLPKTLQGLKDLAKIYNIDVNKITVEDIELKVDKQTKTDTTNKEVNKLENKDVKILQKDEPKQYELKVDKQTKTDEIKDLNTKSILFKDSRSTDVVSKHTTEQIVQVKPHEVLSKKKTDSSILSSLISGEEILKQDKEASLKVSSLDSSSNVKNLFEQSDIQESDDNTKNVHKNTLTVDFKIDNTKVNDELKLKLNESKQMIKYISQDIKQSISEYKSPFTRVKLQLNPKNLGEIDLTMVQRGKNLHINLSSNNTAINSLALNSNELKVQLQNSGINNASLNFSNNSQSSEQSFSGQQQHSQNGNRARDEYDFFNNENSNEEVSSLLEIIVPHYA